MATKRTRQARHLGQRITPEAVEAYRAAKAGWDRYLACLRGEPCDSAAPDQHCAVCAEHLDASRTLSKALGLRPWECSPLEVTDGPAPDFWDADAWAAAQELRRELEKAAAE